jgi:hypothetical protein
MILEILERGIRKVRTYLNQILGYWKISILGTTIPDRDVIQDLNSTTKYQASPGLTNQSDIVRRSFFFLEGIWNQGDILRREILNTCGGHITITASNLISNQMVDILGSGSSPLGDPIDFHIDFINNHKFNPKTYYPWIQPATYPGGYEIKMPWELSRFQHVPWLGQAYWLVRDEKYAAEFVCQVEDWIGQNPPQLGVNWACTMDVAIRVVNWLWGYHYFKDSPSLTYDFRLEFLKSLLIHGRHIKRNLEWSETLTTNHYLSDLVGLIYLGVLLPEFKEAPNWRELGLKELEKEIFKQVYPDGVDFEASISYHRLATELFLSPLLLCQMNGIPISDQVLDRLEKMIEFVMYYTKPDGMAPMIGDNDNGRLHRLKVWAEPDREWVDHRYLLAIGAVLFEREDFARAAGDQWEEAFWLLGPRALEFKQRADATESSQKIRLGSKAFPDAGIYIMRGEDVYVIVDAGGVGQNGYGGHAHNDTLSFEFYAHGHTWIVDPGTYVYTADYEARHAFRSTAFHNTLMINGIEQHPCDSRHPFRMMDHQKPRILRWSTGSERDELVAQFTSSQRKLKGILHRRSFVLDKRSKSLHIRDEVEGLKDGSFTFFLQTPAEVALDGRVAQLFMKQTSLEISTSYGNWELTEGWLSKGYGQSSRINRLLVRDCGVSALDVVFRFP